MGLYTTQYYSEINKDEMMPYPVTGKKLEVIILCEVRKGKHHRISFLVESINGYKELHYKRETVSQTWKRISWLPNKKVERGQGATSCVIFIHIS